MQPRDSDIRNLALYAPRFALAMIRGVPRVPFVGDFPISFSSATVEAPAVIAGLENNLTQDTLVERISFSLFQPESFSGSVFQAQAFAYLKESTGVGVKVDVYGGPKYSVNDTYTALENLWDVFAITWPQGWPLYKQSNVKMAAILTQTPASTPYDVNITLLGWQWLDKCMDDMSDAEAREELNKLKIYSPDVLQRTAGG
jgi:hypothetical protein